METIQFNKGFCDLVLSPVNSYEYIKRTPYILRPNQSLKFCSFLINITIHYPICFLALFFVLLAAPHPTPGKTLDHLDSNSQSPRTLYPTNTFISNIPIGMIPARFHAQITKKQVISTKYSKTVREMRKITEIHCNKDFHLVINTALLQKIHRKG